MKLFYWNIEEKTSAFGTAASTLPSKQKGLWRVYYGKIHEFRFELLPHPIYSPNLAPSDYHLFPDLKNGLEVSYLEGSSKSLNSDGKKALGERWMKCIELRGVYIEKQICI